MESARDQWERYRRALGDEPLPCALVDLDAFDRNAAALFALARGSGRSVRLASKSVRVPALLKRLFTLGAGAARGLMTFTAAETAWLASDGFDDLLLAYPTLHPRDCAMLAKVNQSATAAVAVDDVAQVEALARAGKAAGVKLPLVIDLDVSYRPFGDSGPHLGVRRSPLRTPGQVVALARAIAASEGARFHGLLAYEAQIAGLADALPGAAAQNAGKRLLKKLSQPDVAVSRARVVAALSSAGLAPTLVNGGGTGNLAAAASDRSLTEVTVGSGFLASHLFTSYAGLALEPALYFALQVTRRPGPALATCHGGGIVASGEAAPDRLPIPSLPAGLALLPLEGAGEVQTPLRLEPGVELPLGAPVFFRPAKAGEPLERFNQVLLVQGDRVIDWAPTYRGLGHSFL